MSDIDVNLEVRKTHLTPTEFARLAGVSRQTVVKRIRDKRIPATRTKGGHWRIDPSVVTGKDADAVLVERIPANVAGA